MPETHQDRTDGLLNLFQTAPRSITAAFDDDEDDEYHNWALQESQSCPTCGEHHRPEQTAECPYGGCYDGEHCPDECPYETGHTNWDHVYPHLGDTIHRGVSVHVPGHDPDAPHHEAAQHILDHLGGEDGLGTHWSTSETQGRHYAHVSHLPGRHNLHVVLHAAKPDRSDIEEDPHELLKGDVIGFDQHPDAEIPLQRNARVHVTGVSWQAPGQRDWTRHDFEAAPVQHKASGTADYFGPTEPGHCTICKKPLAKTCPYGGGCAPGEHCSTHCPYEGSWSDWDRYYPRLPDTIHRGFALDIPAPAATAFRHETAQHILNHLDQGTGMHRTAKADEARSAAARHHIPGHTNLHVILHAAKPAREHLETDPDRLIHHAVFGYETSDEAEVPMRSGAPLHITGVTWKPPGARDWAHHDFDQPIQRQALRQEAGGKPWLPHDRYFGPGHPDLDPRLFDGIHLKPHWRRALLGLVNRAFAEYTYRVPGGWQRWARAYLAGSQASHWYGNDDLDVLVGIEYDQFRRAQPRYRSMSDREIDEMLNARAHEVCDPARWFTIDGKHLGPFDSTVYVNPDSYDIRKIKPYAAYDLRSDRWAVRPMKVPDDFGPDKLPSADFLYARSLASQVRALRKLPTGQAQALGAALYDQLHGQRHDAFSGHGGGLYDVRNVAWKYLALHPEKPMEQLVAWKRAEQAEPAPHTAGMSGPGSDASFNDDSAMIALVPPRDVAERLVLPDGKGEPADQMHITLAYIPHVPRGDLGRLTGTVAEWASRQQPIVARVQGAGTFVNPGKHVLWGAVDIPGSSHLHSSLVDALRAAKFQPSTDHGFTAHLTLSYEKYHVRFLPKIDPVSFTCHSVYVCQGDNWRPVPVGGSTGGKVT